MSKRRPAPVVADSSERTLVLVLTFLAAVRLVASGSIYPWSAYLMNGCTALLLIVFFLRRPGTLSRLDPWLGAGLLIYFGAGLLTIPFSLLPFASLRWFFLNLGGLLLFLAVAMAGRSALRPLAGAIVAAAAISSLFAIRQRFGGFAATLNAQGITEFAREWIREGRVFGLTFSPDMLAAILAGVIPLGLAFLVCGRAPGLGEKKTGGAAWLLPGMALGLFAVTLVFTRSVGGFLAAGAGVLAWLWLRSGTSPAAPNFLPPRFRRFFLPAVVLVVIMGALALIALRGGHVLNLEDKENPARRRLDNWATGFRVYREFPFSGAGGGQYGLAMLYHRSVFGNEAKHTHNAMIETLAETGPLGLLGLLLILAAFLRRAWVWRRTPPPGETNESESARGELERELTAGFLAGGIAIVLHSLIDFDWAVPEVATIFWIALAAVNVGGKETAGPAPRRLVRGAAIAALVITALAEFYHMQGSRLKEGAVEKARDKDWAKAYTLAQQTLRWDRTYDEMYELLANAEMVLNPRSRPTVAAVISYLQQAIALNPRYPYYYRDLGVVENEDNRAAAGKDFAKAVALYPNSLDLNLRLGKWLREEKRDVEAERVLRHAAECGPDNGDVLLELGVLFLTQGRTPEAEKFLRSSVKALPVRGYRAVALAGFLVNRGRKPEAAAFLEAWAREHPGDPAVAAELMKLRKPPGAAP